MTGDVVARTLSSVAYACGVALVNVAYVLLLWLLIASPKSVRYLETILLYLAARPFLTIALGILSYFVVIVVRGFLTAQLRVLQRWSLRSLKGPRRPGFKEALRRVLAHVFRLRAQAQLTKRAAGKKAGPGPSGAGKASARRGMRSFAVDVDPESPPSHFLANEPETSDLSLGGSEQTPREDRGAELFFRICLCIARSAWMDGRVTFSKRLTLTETGSHLLSHTAFDLSL